MARIKVEETKSLTGLILMTGVSLVVLGIFTKDLNLLWFSLPIIFALIVAISRGSKDIDVAVKSIGITASNIKTSIPLGILSGIAVFIVGSLIITFTETNTASLIPTFTIASLTMGSSNIIPAGLFLAVNVIIQWLIIAPSEELGFRFLAPYVIYSLSKSLPFAILMGTFLWIFTHIPTFILQGVSNSMYLVLLLLGLVSMALIYITGDIVSAWIAHGTFNTLVLLFTAVYSNISTLIIISLLLVFFIFYTKAGDKNAKHSPFNL